LITRVLSALVLIVIVGGTIGWLPPVATLILAAFAAGAAGVELCGLSRSGDAQPSPLLAAASAGATVVAVAAPAVWPGVSGHAWLAMTIGVTLASALFVLATCKPGPGVLPAMAALLMASVYVGLPLGVLVVMRTETGPAAIAWLIAVIASSDTAQYYAGTTFGRHKLAPVVSPGKTIEGAIGGLLAAPLAGATLAGFVGNGATFSSAIAAAGLALMLAMFGIAGDLFESLLKRSAGAKDSSTLIPGHGGVLDRIDAYLFAAPVMYLFLRYVA
jgi:phosphatidate cytidylyltransferase